MRRLLLPLAGLLVLFLAGCQRLDYEKGLTLPKGARYLEVEFKALKKEQTVSVSVASPEAEVRVYLVLADDKAEAINALLQGNSPRKILAGSEGGNDLSVESKIPGGKPFVVLIRPVKPTAKDVEVKVRVKGG